MDVRFVWSSVAAGLLVIAGCGHEAGHSPATADKAPAGDGHGHDHDHDADHDHGHGHGSGPNGGVVFDLGMYHAEFTVDHGKSECAVLLLDLDASSPIEVKAEELTLTTKPTKTKEGQAVPAMTIALKPIDAKNGAASKFVGTDPGLANVADFEGTVIAPINGKPSQGEFKE